MGDSLLDSERAGIYRAGFVHREYHGQSDYGMPIDPAPQPAPGTPGLPTHDGKAYYIKVSAQPDGTFTVTNQRNLFSKTYAAR